MLPPQSALPAGSPLLEIAHRLAEGDAVTHAAVAKAGTHLGALLQNLIAAYDPACIVLGGSAIELGERFIQPALDMLNDYAAAASLSPPTVRVSRFGADAVAVGAAALARYRLTRPLSAPNPGGGAAAHRVAQKTEEPLAPHSSATHAARRHAMQETD